jgi:hypothetical protein
MKRVEKEYRDSKLYFSTDNKRFGCRLIIEFVITIEKVQGKQMEMVFGEGCE